MDILKHELYKIYFRKSLYLAALFFLLIYGLYAYGLSGDPAINRQLAIYLGAAQGPVTAQKVNIAEQGQKELENHPENYATDVKVVPGEGTSMKMTPEGMAKLQFYSAILSMSAQIRDRSAALAELSNEIDSLTKANSANTFGYRTKALEYQMLQNTSNPVVGYSGGWAQVIDFIPTFGLVFTGALILLGLSPVFSEEYSTGMASIILSSKHGKGKVITAKILAACIYIAGLVLFFALLNTATCFLLLGTNGGGYPLQNIYLYHASPYALTLARYFIYEILVFLAGSLAFGLLILFLSSLSRSALIPLFAGGLVFATPLALLKLGINIAWLNRLCELSYSEVMRVKNLFISFKVYDFFGRPVLYLDVVLLAVVVYSMVSVGLTYYTFKRHQVS